MEDRLKDFVAPGSEEEALLHHLDFSRLPLHIAIIMDGNGRWAEKRNLPRIEGHKAGSRAVKEAVESCFRLGIKYLTLYAFSKENWRRPASEVNMLWELLYDYLRKEDKELVKNKIKLKVIGQREGIPPKVCQELARVEALTRDFESMVVLLALNYGGRTEIVEAVKKIIKENKLKPDQIDENTFSQYLYTAGIPDPDLLIRTSGELRVSNFLLWQIAYAEIWITPDYWPDFSRRHLLQALIDYQKRERRFGAVRHPSAQSLP
ncbi:MAG: isoprenyl transferase [Candidatus Aminicenantes bacterium]|nr:isoprenyl transferase [Candidatus Aminicenantes bacterium]